MTRFGLDLTCPQCSGPLTLVNSTSNGLLSLAILDCTPCNRQWELSARITVHRDAGRERATKQKQRQRARAALRSQDSAPVSLAPWPPLSPPRLPARH